MKALNNKLIDEAIKRHFNSVNNEGLGFLQTNMDALSNELKERLRACQPKQDLIEVEAKIRRQAEIEEYDGETFTAYGLRVAAKIISSHRIATNLLTKLK